MLLMQTHLIYNIFGEMYKKKVLDWWSLFYIDRENEVIDDKKKGFIVFNKEELQKIEAC